MGQSLTAQGSCSAARAGPALTVLVFSWVNSKRAFENPLWEGRAELGNHGLDGTDNLLFLSRKSCKAHQVSLSQCSLFVAVELIKALMWTHSDERQWEHKREESEKKVAGMMHKESHCNMQPSAQKNCTHSCAQPLFLLRKGSSTSVNPWERSKLKEVSFSCSQSGATDREEHLSALNVCQWSTQNREAGKDLL